MAYESLWTSRAKRGIANLRRQRVEVSRPVEVSRQLRTNLFRSCGWTHFIASRDDLWTQTAGRASPRC